MGFFLIGGATLVTWILTFGWDNWGLALTVALSSLVVAFIQPGRKLCRRDAAKADEEDARR